MIYNIFSKLQQLFLWFTFPYILTLTSAVCILPESRFYCRSLNEG